MPFQFGKQWKNELKIKVFTNNKNKGKLAKINSTTLLCLCNSGNGMINESAKVIIEKQSSFLEIFVDFFD